MEYFTLLPEEITLDILSRLPTEIVLGCKLVSTAWRNHVRHPSFSRMHFHRLNQPAADSCKLSFIALTHRRENENFRYFEYDENHESIERIGKFNFISPFWFDTVFLGSVNGLICFVRDQFVLGKTYICNPITREYIKLSKSRRSGLDLGATGFGYLSSTDEYKVVRIMFEDEFMEVQIYTLGSGHGWRSLGKFTFGARKFYGKGMFVNGALYWMNRHSKVIVTFDLAEEKFCEHLLPPSSPDSDRYDWYEKVGVLDGCLSVVVGRRVDGTLCYDVWLLKKRNDNYDNKERTEHQSMGWSRVFRIFDLDFFAVTKSYGVLTFSDTHINFLNLEASTSMRIGDLRELIGQVVGHKNTLVSLKELGEKDTKMMGVS